MTASNSPVNYLLGIDVGTTGTKALLFRQDGKLIGQAYRGYPMHNPSVGYSEQRAHDWWNAVVATVRELCPCEDIASHVAAISLSLQGGTVVPVDQHGVPLRPAIVWNDTRCAAQKAAFLQEFQDAAHMYQKTGWRLIDGLPLLQIRWMKENEPEIFAQTSKFLTVPDYIAYRMTGKAAVDLSDAGINQLVDIRSRCYDDALLAFAGIDESKLPPLVSSGDVIGHLTQEAASLLGLTTDTLLVAGAHDQYAVALGAGALNDGDILIGSGTCWVVTSISDGPDFDSCLSQSISAVPGKWGSMAELSGGGVYMDWWRKKLTTGNDGAPLPYDLINEEAAKRCGAEEGLFFFPGTGLATDNTHLKKSTFFGLDLSHDRFHMIRAIMEGIAFQIVWMLGHFRSKPSERGLILAGGASKSLLWCQIVADVANLPVRIPEVSDLACVGAAILAGVGSGLYKDVEDGYSALAISERVIQPNPVQAEKYRKYFKNYQKTAALLGQAEE